MKLLAAGILLCTIASFVQVQSQGFGDLLAWQLGEFNLPNCTSQGDEQYALFQDMGIVPAFLTHTPEKRVQLQFAQRRYWTEGGDLFEASEITKHPDIRDYVDDTKNNYAMMFTDIDANNGKGQRVNKVVWLAVNRNKTNAGDLVIDWNKKPAPAGVGCHRIVCLLFNQGSEIVDAKKIWKDYQDVQNKATIPALSKMFSPPDQGTAFWVQY